MNRYNRMVAIWLLWSHLVLLAAGSQLRADILRWDDDTVIPGTRGMVVGPQSNLTRLNLAFAELSNVDLTGADLQGANLVDAHFWYADLANANFSDAVITRTSFASAKGLVKEQLYSTASYRRHDLRRLDLVGQDLTGWNFAGQDLRGGSLNSTTIANTNFVGANLDGVDLYAANITTGDFTGANVVNLTFSFGELTGANFTRADTRGSIAFHTDGAIVRNTILPDGHIHGLTLNEGEKLRIRDHQGRPSFVPGQRDPAIGITIEQQLSMAGDASIELIVGDDDWGSVISFEPGADVRLAGTLELIFADGVNVSAQTGRTLQLFDWTNVSPNGRFAIASPYTWDLSRLYTTGEATLLSVIAGDLNADDRVDGADAGILFSNWGSNNLGDINHDGVVDAADAGVTFTEWTGDGHPVSVPEPVCSIYMVGILAAVVMASQSQRPARDARGDRRFKKVSRVPQSHLARDKRSSYVSAADALRSNCRKRISSGPRCASLQRFGSEPRSENTPS